MPSGFTASTPDSLALDVGVLSVNGTPIGLSQGGLDFDPGIVDREVEFDGKRASIAEMEYRVDYNSVIKGKFITLDSTFLTYLEPGGNVAGGVTTPISCGTRYATGDYLSNVTLDMERGDGTSFSVKFATARVIKWSLDSKDKREGLVDVTIKAYLSATDAASSTDGCPYQLIEA